VPDPGFGGDQCRRPVPMSTQWSQPDPRVAPLLSNGPAWPERVCSFQRPYRICHGVGTSGSVPWGGWPYTLRVSERDADRVGSIRHTAKGTFIMAPNRRIVVATALASATVNSSRVIRRGP